MKDMKIRIGIDKSNTDSRAVYLEVLSNYSVIYYQVWLTDAVEILPSIDAIPTGEVSVYVSNDISKWYINGQVYDIQTTDDHIDIVVKYEDNIIEKHTFY